MFSYPFQRYPLTIFSVPGIAIDNVDIRVNKVNVTSTLSDFTFVKISRYTDNTPMGEVQ